MDTRLVLDLETKRTFDEVGGRDHLDQLEITVVGVYDYATREYRTYEESETGALQNLLINASLIIGFNHIGFDMPVLQPYLSIDAKKLPLFDIMLDLQQKLGHRIGLDSVATATLGVGKTGHGIDAIRFYREGKIKELKEYCLNDVKVTKEVFDYGIENGKIHYFSKIGNTKKEIAVEWEKYKSARLVPSLRTEPAQYKLF
ncbi:MAG: ribonuclease H-like domain-containing protein [Deltaproteobacteria bacterium]|nr:ribonuclease H-like domain-containing protein [Deltaproteobacteria bacterium]